MCFGRLQSLLLVDIRVVIIPLADGKFYEKNEDGKLQK